MKRKMWAKEVLNCEPLIINNIDYENLPKNQKDWYFRVFVTDEDLFKNVREYFPDILKARDIIRNGLEHDIIDVKELVTFLADALEKDKENFDEKTGG